MRPQHEVAHIIQQSLSDYLKAHRTSTWKINTLLAIAKCRTHFLGGHSSGCKSCGEVSFQYNSCRNRHCPKCQAVTKERWILAREAELLPVGYFHVVFTLPSEFNSLSLHKPTEVYNALFTASWMTIQTFANDPKHLGAKTGMTAILHTWGQQLSLHPHLHCIIPSGGLTTGSIWKSTKTKGKYLFPKKALSAVFRAKFMEALRKEVDIPQNIAQKVFQKNWVVYAKRPFKTPKTVVEYLGRYTHKIAISNHRIVNVSDKKVSFKYTDYRTDKRGQVMSLSSAEFIRRFALHILPRGFTRIRHYGILSSKNKSTQLGTLREHFGLQPWSKVEIAWERIAEEKWAIKPNTCKKCQGETEILDIIIKKRGPPFRTDS